MQQIANALAALPPGRYAVGVSGGADSVALLRLAAADPRFELVVAHLNHGLRGEESEADESFIRKLAGQLNLPFVAGRLRDFEPPHPAKNDSARYRAARFAFFESVVAAHQLDGVLLAHHADDQAETVLLRVLRGAQLPSLAAMSPRGRIGALTINRPLLPIRRNVLRDFLQSIGQSWREDSSNTSSKYRRNLIRKWLESQPELIDPLLALAAAAAQWRTALEAHSPALAESFSIEALRIAPPLAHHAAGRWLIARGAPPDDVSPATRQRLIDQALDPAAPLRQTYPGNVLVRRRKRRLEVIPAPPMRGPALQSPQRVEPHHGQDQTTPAGEL